ncbi:nucleoside phosphatase family-domain-containing protein [Schizophyllum amplum]|uniref:Nucleoside phosphatase family-domain-containing protein n=1 Tax=Schizophyllum amplum TaxID=97359 RepID=A0A550C333_9AGAR|nr:nucleoside phosphatase family-domain-containing protein [Auriculariopsis ampla]
MPPPNAGDAWLAGRHFGIVIDAGSSGSRLLIYSWKDPQAVILEAGENIPPMLPKVEKGAQSGEDWVTKAEPGLSSFAENVDGIPAYLRPLLDHARNNIPPSLHHETPLFLLATAGMRLLTPTQQAEVLQETCRFLALHSNFKIDGPSASGPCGSSVRIITGEEEGLFGWIAVNYLMDGFIGSSDIRTTYGFLDMGGASTQIAFEPGEDHASEDDTSLVEVRLRLLTGEEIRHKVFVTTWLGYGTNQARERYVGQTIRDYERTREGGEPDPSEDIIPDPCLPKDLIVSEHPVHSGDVPSHAQKTHKLRGTGSFEQCMRQSSTLLNKDAPCSTSPCPMNGVHVPPIDFSVSHFIGVSEYWYSSDHVFGLGGAYDFVQYERAASDFCARDWQGIVDDHVKSRQQNRPAGDGEVMENGEVVAVGKWGENVEISRLEMQCFKAAWIVNVLHDGLGMPRIVDPDGNKTTEGKKVEAQAAIKGLGRPTFQSVDTVGDIAISWTLGKMVLEASKEVPLKTVTDRPLQDPIDDIPITADSPIQPIRPPFFDLDAIEDSITPHLPSSLQRSSLGFSPVLFLFCILLVASFSVVVYPLRHRLRSLMRYLRKRNSYRLMEEGRTTWPSTPSSPLPKKWLRRVLPAPISTARNGTPGLNSPISMAPRISPIRSYSLPSDTFAAATSAHSQGLAPSSLSTRSLASRNGSQLSLHSAARASGGLSRVNSSAHLPGLARED